MKRFLVNTVLIIAAFLLLSPSVFAVSYPAQTSKLWEYVEWSVENPSYSGNPFDVVATATFTHTNSGEKRTTEMFYNGGTTWKFRFTGTKTGGWTFTTSSTDTDLHGHTGSITVNQQDNPNIKGFIEHQFTNSENGTKWTRSNGEAFVPQLAMYKDPRLIYTNTSAVPADVQNFIVGHGFNGLHIPSVAGQWFNNSSSTAGVSSTATNPDARTFEALELVIKETYNKGGIVHIWLWGDSARNQTPENLLGGINGAEDRRLQRYIAARLGPLPGWSLGYGFDLWEWISGAQLDQWYTYTHEHFGWKHYLGARASKNILDQLSEKMDYSGYEWHRPDYADYIDHINTRPLKPSFSEDRFRLCNGHDYKDYDLVMTRRGLYHSTMAGGVANIWGNLCNMASDRYGSNTYANKTELKTYSTFFFDNKRFTTDMLRDNTHSTNGTYVLKTSSNSYVFYKEGTASFDYQNLPSGLPIIAVNAGAAYSEVSLGTTSSTGSGTITLPTTSDWAVAIGTFEGSSTIPTPTSTPTGPTATPTATSTPAPTNTPAPGAIITSITPSTYLSRVNVQLGSLLYIDRSYSFSSLPSYLLGANYIQTANADRGTTSDSFLTFTLTEPATIYVAHDKRITTKPSWLSSFTLETETASSTDTTFDLYSRSYPQGTVTLGGNAGASLSMYSVIVVPSATTPPPTGTDKPGDTDLDGDVDIFDYNVVISNFGQSVTGAANGDLDGDGDVDIFDYNLVISNFGR